MTLPTQTAWEAGPEMDAFLGQLRADDTAVKTALRSMTLEEIATFKYRLHQLQVAVYEIGTKKALWAKANADTVWRQQ